MGPFFIQNVKSRNLEMCIFYTIFEKKFIIPNFVPHFLKKNLKSRFRFFVNFFANQVLLQYLAILSEKD
jgi:hypothetical protein